ncbi:MAG TPA: 2-dehydropantoate 2-reductase, partial [Chryseolinea sp.]|nr:2-dehydropantoate 2-reductase [Chryseolinea sp.]
PLIMRIGIIGTGAVGGFIGAKMKLAGYDVAFLSRGKNFKAVSRNGLIFETEGKVYTIKEVIFTDRPRNLGKCDFLIFTVKSYDTRRTAKQIKNIVSKKTTVITPQNGIDNDIVLAKILGKEKILPAMIKIGVNTPKPAWVKHTSLGVLTVGEYDGSYSSRIKKIESIATKSGIRIVVSNKIQVERWKKFIWNCSFNIVAAISRMSVDQILADSYLRKLSINTMTEVIKVAHKEKIDVDEKEEIKTNIKFAESLGSFKPSTLEDLEKGKPIELDALTGVVLSLGKKHKIKTPINSVLYALLHGKTRV